MINEPQQVARTGARAAVYARVSTDQQVIKSGLEVQVAECRRYAQAQGYEIADVYQDEGISGAHNAKYRDGLDRMLADARAGQFTILLVHELDRLARELGVGMQIVGAVAESRIRLIEVTSGMAFDDHGALLHLVKLWGAGEDRKRILIRTKRGQVARAKQGKVSGPAPLGYERDVDGGLQVEEVEAELVRRIYRMYLDEGRHVEAIAAILNAEGILTKRARANATGKNKFRGADRWQRSTILCVLKNPVYKGTYVYGKTHGRVKAGKEYVPNPKRPLHKANLETAIKNRDFLPHEQVEVAVPAIVDETTWEAAKLRLAENGKKAYLNKGPTKNNYLFAGVVRCASCGRVMTRTTMTHPRKRKEKPLKKSYYVCRNRDRDCPNLNKHHPMGRVDHAILMRLLPYLQDPSLIATAYEAASGTRVARFHELNAEAEAIDARLDAIQAEIRRLVNGFAEGALTKEELKTARDARNEEADRLAVRGRAIIAEAQELTNDSELAALPTVIHRLTEITKMRPLSQGLMTSAHMTFAKLPKEHDDYVPSPLVTLAQDLVSRVTIDCNSQIVDYRLRVPVPELDPDDQGPDYGSHTAKRKCTTSPSLTT